MLNTDTESNGLCKSDVNNEAIEELLSEPVKPEGQRNEHIKHLSRQLRANGMGREEYLRVITERYPIGTGKKRQITESYLLSCYDRAANYPLEPWTTSGTTFKPKQRYSIQKVSQEPGMSGVESKPASDGRIKTSHFFRLNRLEMFWQGVI